MGNVAYIHAKQMEKKINTGKETWVKTSSMKKWPTEWTAAEYQKALIKMNTDMIN